jgi:hypothetical protein
VPACITDLAYSENIVNIQVLERWPHSEINVYETAAKVQATGKRAITSRLISSVCGRNMCKRALGSHASDRRSGDVTPELEYTRQNHCTKM